MDSAKARPVPQLVPSRVYVSKEDRWYTMAAYRRKLWFEKMKTRLRRTFGQREDSDGNGIHERR